MREDVNFLFMALQRQTWITYIEGRIDAQQGSIAKGEKFDFLNGLENFCKAVSNQHFC